MELKCSKNRWVKENGIFFYDSENVYCFNIFQDISAVSKEKKVVSRINHKYHKKKKKKEQKKISIRIRRDAIRGEIVFRRILQRHYILSLNVYGDFFQHINRIIKIFKYKLN